jgi:hypothetical protein
MILVTKNLSTCSKECKKYHYANIKGNWKIKTPILHIEEKTWKEKKKKSSKENNPIFHLQEKNEEKQKIQ